MHWNIREKILSGFAVVMILAIVMVAGAFLSLTVIQNVVASLTPSEELRDRIIEVQQIVRDMENHLDQYLTISGEEYRKRIASDNELLEQKLTALVNGEGAISEDRPEYRSVMTEGASLGREINLLLSLNLRGEAAGLLNNQILNTYARISDISQTLDELALESRRKVDEQIAGVGLIIEQTIVSVLYFMLTLFVTAIIVSVFIARMLTKPTLALIGVAKRFSEGDHTVRANITSRDEIGELARVFNEMASTVESYTIGLESQVHERTKELDEKVITLNAANAELDNRATLLLKRGKELTVANEKLQELDKIKSEFLSIAAHQLRTPLSAVRWIFSVLLEGHLGELAPEQKGYLIKGEESNNRMIRLVDDMLTVTRIESGKMKFTLYALALEDILRSMLGDFTPVAKGKGIELIYTQAEAQGEGGYPKVLVDPEKIRFLFENILENAMRYTPQGGKVTIGLTQEEDTLVVSITDTGIGIPEHEQKNIFSKFYRATNAVKIVTDGSGLGLFVAKSVAEHHGGSLTFTSKVGVGTTFRAALPVLTQ